MHRERSSHGKILPSFYSTSIGWISYAPMITSHKTEWLPFEFSVPSWRKQYRRSSHSTSIQNPRWFHWYRDKLTTKFAFWSKVFHFNILSRKQILGNRGDLCTGIVTIVNSRTENVTVAVKVNSYLPFILLAIVPYYLFLFFFGWISYAPLLRMIQNDRPSRSHSWRKQHRLSSHPTPIQNPRWFHWYRDKPYGTGIILRYIFNVIYFI